MIAQALSIVSLASALTTSPCPGDCNGDAMTSDGEVRLAIELVFDEAGLADCTAAEVDDGVVRSSDILRIIASRVELPPGCDPPVPIWVALAPLAAGPRQEVGTAALDGAIYVIGGFDAQPRGTAVVERYDVADDEWHTVRPLPAARQHVGAAALDGAVYSVGGFTGSSFVPASQVYRYVPAENDWTAVEPLPTARGALAVVAFDGRLHAIGGSSASGSVSTHTAYDPEQDEWTSREPFPGAGRNHLAAVVLGGSIYLAGGRFDGGGVTNSAALDRYDPGTNSWTSLAPMRTARSGHGLAAIGGRIVAMGGEVNPANPAGVFPEVEIYDPATDRWTDIDPMPVPRHGLGAVTIGNRIHVPGGALVAGFGPTDVHDALEFR